jgi:MFS family permease
MMNRERLFAASCVALIVTAMSFALRGGAAGAWESEFSLTKENVGWITGTAFWGFTLAMIVGGPLCDILGMKRLAWMAFLGHFIGIGLTMAAWDFWSLFVGTLIFGIANGLVEAACNPLIAAMYVDNKTTKLNHFHVWFPGGIVIGGLLAFGFGEIGLGWRIQFGALLIPTIIYGFMFLGQAFPRTERVESGLSTASMFRACLSPLFLLMVVCMLLTAATELGPGQWIPNILQHAGVNGLLVLVWITGLMAVGRMFAGPFVHSLSPLGMLVGSALLSALGLFLMSQVTGMLMFGAATVFAFGVCFFWPTMLGFVNERIPATGALGLAIMGGAGMLSVSFVLPVMGKIFDQGIQAQLPAELTAEALAAAEAGSEMAMQWSEIQAQAGLDTLGQVAILPIILAVIFAGLLLSGQGKHVHKLANPRAE